MSKVHILSMWIGRYVSTNLCTTGLARTVPSGPILMLVCTPEAQSALTRVLHQLYIITLHY